VTKYKQAKLFPEEKKQSKIPLEERYEIYKKCWEPDITFEEFKKMMEDKEGD